VARKRKPPTVTVSNPKASSLPRGSGNFAKPPAPEPITLKARDAARPGEIFRNSEAVTVTSKTTRSQRTKGGNF
jgi:hypothetical protein